MADLSKDFEYYDAPHVEIIDDVVIFIKDHNYIEVSLEELEAFIKEAKEK